MDRQFSPQEVARRFGVSIKALRLYERHGLLAPLRTEAGWRTYGPTQIAQLHQVLILKRLGLPLAGIAKLLTGRDRLDSVLALQEQVLARQNQSLSQALELVRAARAKLASGAALSIDDLANLNKETVMTLKPDPEELKTLFEPLAQKHFTAEQRAQLHEKKFAQPEIGQAWEQLIPEARALMDKGETDSPAMHDVARRWRGLVRQFTGGDPGLADSLRAVWNDALADPRIARQTPLTPELLAFMRQAVSRLPD